VRSYSELRALVDSEPFPGVTHSSNTYLTATFIKDPRGVPSVVPGQLHPGGTEVVGYDAGARAVLAITDNSEPDRAGGFMVWLERSYGKGITTRSWLTVQRIVRKLES
jgi:hypothetical protein